jgi:hypothetical protein
MAVVSGDIVYFMSGGSGNSNPVNSIGGEPSSSPITGLVNNLFGNISPEESVAGKIDYRCFYVFNQNGIDSLYNTKLYLNSQVSGGSVVTVGVKEATDVQQINISGIDGLPGTFTIAYEGDPVTVAYDSDLSVWSTNLQNGINDNTPLSGVVSSASSVSFGSVSFNLNFAGEDDSRYHELITLVSNDMSGAATFSISKITNGSPVNSIADLLDFDSNAPNDVVFSSPTFDSPIVANTLRSSDGIPIWIKRETEAGVTPIEPDGFQFAVYGNPASM